MKDVESMSKSSTQMVVISGISVKYGFKTAVSDLSLTLSKGQSLGLLGLNGAGKTTTIRALLGMLRPYSGSISLFGEKPGSLKSMEKTGIAPEDGTPPDFLTTQEYMEFTHSFKLPKSKSRKKECLESLEWFELSPSKRISDLSKGMNRRLILAQAFLGNPPLLILDEPLNGLDPLMIIKLREKIELYLKQGGTVLYCSHILSEVEKSCSDVVILREGVSSYMGSVAETQKSFGDVERAFAKFAGKL